MLTIKNHHIKFKSGPKDCQADEWEALISQVGGVKKVKIDPEKRDIYVEYDLEQCCEEAIEHWMERVGFTLDDHFMERVKRGWIHFTEENARENMVAKPLSCCDTEEIEKKRKKLKGKTDA